MKRKKLVIISHTEHYRDSSGIIRGWGSTINEINFLSNYWDEVRHVGCFYDEAAPASSLPYTASNITFIPIPPYGGKKIIDKILIFFKIPKIVFETIKAIKGASEVQLRLPTSMGLFLLPLFSFFIPRTFTFWVKYAGNWKQLNSPLAYRLQRWWLCTNWTKCKVTINGFWDDQPQHCLSFENPCLTDDDIREGIEFAKNKKFKEPFVFCFVGRLDDAKGVDRIIEALKHIKSDKIAEVHFIGDGPLKEKYKESLVFLGNKVIFHGFQNKERVMNILSSTHFLLLPSNSEGFPKVIAEGACYGAIPVVSDVGSIPHYVNDLNGFLWEIEKNIPFESILKEATELDEKTLKEKSNVVLQLAEKFTFINYKKKLMQILEV